MDIGGSTGGGSLKLNAADAEAGDVDQMVRDLALEAKTCKMGF